MWGPFFTVSGDAFIVKNTFLHTIIFYFSSMFRLLSYLCHISRVMMKKIYLYIYVFIYYIQNHTVVCQQSPRSLCCYDALVFLQDKTGISVSYWSSLTQGGGCSVVVLVSVDSPSIHPPPSPHLSVADPGTK